MFGSNIHLNLTPVKVLGPHFAVENRHENGTRGITSPKLDDHFIGTVLSYPGSSIAITVGSKGLVYYNLLLIIHSAEKEWSSVTK